MNKRLRLMISVILIVSAALFVLNIKKLNINLRVRKGKTAVMSGLLAQAQDLEAKGNLAEAQSTYQRLMSEFPNSSQMINWQKKVEGLNIKLLFSQQLTPKSMLYEIQAGDTLTKIAQQFKTTVELMKRSNRLSSDKILPGRKIKVWTTPFNILIDKSQNTLILKTDEEILKTYIVSTGIDNSTPTGNFKIVNKLQNPTWYKAGAIVPPGSPENILGSHWLGLNLKGYGIHGTTEPETLGKQITQGCVRMSNSDVEELYTIIPMGTEVTIVD